MEPVVVVYATKTSHSRRLAQAVGEALHTKAHNVTEGPAPREAELLFIVGGIYGGRSHPQLTAYAEGLDAGLVKKAVLITSSTSLSGRSQPEIAGILKGKGIPVLEDIPCPGSLLFVKMGHPSAADAERVAARARQIAAQK